MIPIMKYGKIENGRIIYAPSILIVDDMQVVNPSNSRLLTAGYLPIEETPVPEIPDGYHAKYHWEAGDEKIHRVWEIEKDYVQTELSQDDITQILADHEYRLCLMELGVV